MAPLGELGPCKCSCRRRIILRFKNPQRHWEHEHHFPSRAGKTAVFAIIYMLSLRRKGLEGTGVRYEGTKDSFS